MVCAAYLTHHEEDIPAWEQIGSDLGLSFQIQDDILDVTSTVEELGKNINSDAQNNKRTYVSLLGIEEAQKEASFYYERAQQRPVSYTHLSCSCSNTIGLRASSFMRL